MRGRARTGRSCRSIAPSSAMRTPLNRLTQGWTSLRPRPNLATPSRQRSRALGWAPWLAPSPYLRGVGRRVGGAAEGVVRGGRVLEEAGQHPAHVRQQQPAGPQIAVHCTFKVSAIFSRSTGSLGVEHQQRDAGVALQVGQPQARAALQLPCRRSRRRRWSRPTARPRLRRRPAGRPRRWPARWAWPRPAARPWRGRARGRRRDRRCIDAVIGLVSGLAGRGRLLAAAVGVQGRQQGGGGHQLDLLHAADLAQLVAQPLQPLGRPLHQQHLQRLVVLQEHVLGGDHLLEDRSAGSGPGRGARARFRPGRSG